MRSIPNPPTKGLAKNRQLQSLTDAVRELQNAPAYDRSRVPFQRIVAEGIGYIVSKGPNGETYATGQSSPDERYWVQLAYVKGGNTWDQLSVAKDGTVTPGIVYATNLPEAASHSHNLPSAITSPQSGKPPGPIVWVWAIMDRDKDQPRLRWVMNEGGYHALVKVTASASGGGKYNGYVWIPGTSDVSASGNLAESDLGDQGPTQVLILNRQEIGQSTHDIKTDGSQSPNIFLGTYLRTNSDGTAVYSIDGQQWKTCS